MQQTIRLAIYLIVVASVCGGVFRFDRSPAGPVDPGGGGYPSILEHEEAGLRYTYHVLTGTESLHDVRTDPRLLLNLLSERPNEARRMRRVLEQRIGIESLDLLRRDLSDRIRALESLGYL